MTLLRGGARACALALLPFSLLIGGPCNAESIHVDKVVVKKSVRRMYLYSGARMIRAYHIALGANPRGDKMRRGDGRTPEGSYMLDFKNPNSAFYKSIHISYPNLEDRLRAQRAGRLIMIHGQKNGYGVYARQNQKFDWTHGCIAVTDRAMDEIWTLVSAGTPIEIEP